MNDETAQRIEWKTRLVAAIVNRQFDDVTLTGMLFAALDQSHAEGVVDAVFIIRGVADQQPNSFLAGLLNKLSDNLLELNAANKAISELLNEAVKVKA